GDVVGGGNSISHLEAGNAFPDLKMIIPYYDGFFPSKSVNVPELLELGARNVHYTQLGYDPCTHYPVQPTREEYDAYKSQIAFIGTYTPARAACLEQMGKYSLSVWGTHWNRKRHGARLRKAIKNRIACGMKFSLVANSSRINLNLLREENRDTHNLKTFELPACGAFVISQRSEELAQFYTEGNEIAAFDTIEELQDKSAYYLRHEEERIRIARAGYQRTKAEKYTIRDRLGTLLAVYNEMKMS
ncbi:MAG: glycosyltransferase, partial [PVC group bacterium]